MGPPVNSLDSPSPGPFAVPLHDAPGCAVVGAVTGAVSG